MFFQSGKTQIANFISESINLEEAVTPRPTQGVRILEFELSSLNLNGKISNIDIELWDCSGDHKYAYLSLNHKYSTAQIFLVLHSVISVSY